MFINPKRRSSGTAGLAPWPTTISHPRIRILQCRGEDSRWTVCPTVMERWISALCSGDCKAAIIDPSTQQTHDVYPAAWAELTDAEMRRALEKGVFPDVSGHPSANSFDLRCGGEPLMCRDLETSKLAQLPPYEKKQLLAYAKSIVLDNPNIIFPEFDTRIREQFPGLPRRRRRELWVEVSSPQQKRPGRRSNASKPLRPRK